MLTKWMGALAAFAAFALGVMFAVFVLTLHAPRVLALPTDPDEWSSALIALAMCGASWVCASALFREPLRHSPPSRAGV